MHIRRKCQWTSEQLKSAYLDLQYFHRRSSKFPAEHLSLFRNDLPPFLSSLFLLYSILGQQQLLFKSKHRSVVPIHGHVCRKLRVWIWSVRSLGRKKGSRLRLCFRVVHDVPEKKRIDLWKQMSSKWSFTCICGIFLPLNPSATTAVYARSAFCTQPAFYSQSAFYPWSAVCVLHWPDSKWLPKY